MVRSVIKMISATAVILGSTVAAYANDHLVVANTQDFTTQITVDIARSTRDGLISVYDYHKGKQGRLLGTHPVKAGANRTVEINFNQYTVKDVIAVLTHNGSTTPVVSEIIDND